MSQSAEEKPKQKRVASSFFVVMNDGQVHVCKGRIALNRVMTKIDQSQMKLIIHGRACRLVPRTSLVVEV